MKKLPLLLLILLSSLLAAHKGEVTLFEEDWESYPEQVMPVPEGDANWLMRIHPNGRPFGIWSISHSGTRSVSHTTAGPTSGKPRDWLICRKALEIPEAGGKLSYWVQASRSSDYEVRISQTIMNDTTQYTDYLFNGSTTSPTFEKKTFDLGVYAGKTIFVAWKRKGPYGLGVGSNWIIDDIKIVAYTEDHEGPDCIYTTGLEAFTGQNMHLRAAFNDQTSIESVSAVTVFNGTTSEPIAMERSAADPAVFTLVVPHNEAYTEGIIRFIAEDNLGNTQQSADKQISWGNKLLDENFETVFPPEGWQNKGWKQLAEYGANGTNCAYSGFLANGTLTTFPVTLTADSKLSFYTANRYLGAKITGTDTIYCEASDNNGADWAIINQHSPSTPDLAHVKYEIDLTQLTGSEITFRWRHSTIGTTDAEGALVDSILIFSKYPHTIEDQPAQIKSAHIISSYPNPFNNVTTVSYQIRETADIKLSVYNAKGEMVKTLFQGVQQAGVYKSTFNASGLNSGVYFYRLTTPEGFCTNKVMFLK